jgi:predicted site-specific integrase-resolvase
MRSSKDTSTLDILTGGLRIGYARTSKQDQNLDLQRDALIAAGCTRIYEEQISGARANRPELEQMLKALRPGDTVVVWQLSRFGRSLSHLLSSWPNWKPCRFASNRSPNTSTPARRAGGCS